MMDVVLKVDGMSCEHCEKSIVKAVGALSGVSAVKVDLAAGTVKVEHDPALVSVLQIREEIEEQGYDIV